jgi:hypothetical protein
VSTTPFLCCTSLSSFCDLEEFNPGSLYYYPSVMSLKFAEQFICSVV